MVYWPEQSAGQSSQMAECCAEKLTWMVVLARAFSWSIVTNGCMFANSGGVITCTDEISHHQMGAC